MTPVEMRKLAFNKKAKAKLILSGLTAVSRHQEDRVVEFVDNLLESAKLEMSAYFEEKYGTHNQV